MRGLATAELLRRDREYAEEQEKSRRHFEMELFNAESGRDTKRKEFEQRLANEQMAHAEKLVERQDRTANKVAQATIFAAVAAGLSALGVVVTAALEALKYVAAK